MAMIFFFAEHMDVRKAPHILVGGVFGIACILLATPTIGALAPLIGFEFARLIYILGIVFAIVAFGEMAPMIFNNYAFMFLTVTGLAMQLPAARSLPVDGRCCCGRRASDRRCPRHRQADVSSAAPPPAS